MPLRVAVLALLSLLALAGCGAISSQGASSQKTQNTAKGYTARADGDDHRKPGDAHHRSLDYEPGDTGARHHRQRPGGQRLCHRH